jgi:glycosyltransferase involved in cell wall biosynthesis
MERSRVTRWDSGASRLRVVTLTDSLSASGGAEKLAAEVTLRLDPNRFERVFCSSRGYADSSYAAAFEQAGIQLLLLKRRGKTDLAAWLPLLRALRRTDVLHTHKFESNVWGAAWGSLLRVPVIVAHEHTWSYQGQPFRRFLDRELVARSVSAFVMVSREDERRAHEIEGVDRSRTIYMPNGVAPLAASGASVREELGIPAAAPVIGTVAVLRPQKALHNLIIATAFLKTEIPGLHVLIAGDGPERQQLTELVSTLGLEGSIHLLGRRSDVADVVAAFDVAVTCSDFEGSPLSVMEYMSSGKPVVATRVGGVPDLIEDRVHGRLVEPGAPRALAEAIGELLRDPALRAELGRNAFARQRREFSIEQAVERFERLYETLHLSRGLTPRRKQLANARPFLLQPSTVSWIMRQKLDRRRISVPVPVERRVATHDRRRPSTAPAIAATT